MKKLILVMLAMLTSITMLSGCGKNENLIRINQVTNSIFYAPMYAAINNGYFADEGYEIELSTGGGSDASMSALISKSADVILAGPETAVFVAAQGKKDIPVIFGQLTKRDGSFLVGRKPEPNFKFSDLAGKEVIGGRRGGMPAMSLQYAMERSGLTLGKNVAAGEAYLNLDVKFDMVVGAFEGGQGDYCTMFEPLASQYKAAGKGYIVADVGTTSGEIPFTAFMTSSSFLNNNKAKLETFLKVIKKGYNFITTASIDEVALSLKKSFPGTDLESIKKSILNYNKIDAWASSPVLSEDNFTRMKTVMRNAGELTKEVAFSTVVNNSIAEKIAA